VLVCGRDVIKEEIIFYTLFLVFREHDPVKEEPGETPTYSCGKAFIMG
jgi:hypothetical protein